MILGNFPARECLESREARLKIREIAYSPNLRNFPVPSRTYEVSL